MSTFSYKEDSFDGQKRWGHVGYYVDDQGKEQEATTVDKLPPYIANIREYHDKRQHYLTDLAKYVMQDNLLLSRNQNVFTIYESRDQMFGLINPKGFHLRDTRLNTDEKTLQIIMVNDDTLEVAEAFSRVYEEWPLILNFASPFQPGGDFKSGASTQEEMLMYRSSYYHSLNAAHQFITREKMLNETDFDAISMNRGKYIPFHRCIHSPHVYIYGDLHKDFKRITLDPTDKIRKVSMIAAAAPCFIGQNVTEEMLTTTVKDALTTMWTTIIKTAMACGNKHLLLGPIGCGAFAPKRKKEDYKRLVASTLCQVLTTYGNYFETIIFADYDSKKQYENYKIFKDQFEANKGFNVHEMGIDTLKKLPKYDPKNVAMPRTKTPLIREIVPTPKQNQSRVIPTQVSQHHTIPLPSHKNVPSSVDPSPKKSPDQTPKNVPSSPTPKNTLPSKNHVPKNTLPSNQENIQSSPSIAFLGTIYLFTFIASTIAISMR